MVGIGPKSAKTLLQTFGGLDEIYAQLDAVPEKLYAKLTARREYALISRQVAMLKQDQDLQLQGNLKTLRYAGQAVQRPPDA